MNQQTLSRMHELPTNRQLEIFYMLHQLKSQSYECQTPNLGNVVFSNVARNPSLSLSPDQLTVIGAQGYRTALATHGVTEGTYYYEATYELPKNYQPGEPQYEPAARIGWATPAAHLDGPVGYDEHGYALRTVDGSLCHKRQRIPGTLQCQQQLKQDSSTEQPARIRPGQVIGCLIHLPPFSPKSPLPLETEMCESRQVKPTVRRSEEAVPVEQMAKQFDLEKEIVPDSFVRFFVDGVAVAQHTDLCYNRYYPAVSPYNFSSVTANFGLKNIKIGGFPDDFFVMAPFLAQYGAQIDPCVGRKLDFDEIFHQIDEENAKNPPPQQLQQLQLQNPIPMEGVSQSVTSPVPESKNEEDTGTSAELREIYSHIANEDLFRTGSKKSDFKNFLKAIWNKQQQQVKTITNDFVFENHLLKGFKHPPVYHFEPVSMLYRRRSETDYQAVIQAVQAGYYSDDLHVEIGRLMRESESRAKKSKK